MPKSIHKPGTENLFPSELLERVSTMARTYPEAKIFHWLGSHGSVPDAEGLETLVQGADAIVLENSVGSGLEERILRLFSSGLLEPAELGELIEANEFSHAFHDAIGGTGKRIYIEKGNARSARRIEQLLEDQLGKRLGAQALLLPPQAFCSLMRNWFSEFADLNRKREASLLEETLRAIEDTGGGRILVQTGGIHDAFRKPLEESFTHRVRHISHQGLGENAYPYLIRLLHDSINGLPVTDSALELLMLQCLILSSDFDIPNWDEALLQGIKTIFSAAFHMPQDLHGAFIREGFNKGNYLKALNTSLLCGYLEKHPSSVTSILQSGDTRRMIVRLFSPKQTGPKGWKEALGRFVSGHREEIRRYFQSRAEVLDVDVRNYASFIKDPKGNRHVRWFLQKRGS